MLMRASVDHSFSLLHSDIHCMRILYSNLLTHSPVDGHVDSFQDFFFYDFLMWTIFNVFIEFVTMLLLFFVLIVWPRGMWDLSSLTRDRTLTPCIGRQSLDHWTAREVPGFFFFLPLKCCIKRND